MASRQPRGRVMEIASARKQFKSAIRRLRKMPDEDVLRVLGDGLLDDLLKALAPAKTLGGPLAIYEHLKQHKHGRA